MRQSISAVCIVAFLCGCAACHPGIDPITVKQQPGAIVVATLNCNY